MAKAYYKRFAQDALNGKRHLSMEQRGVYDTVIDLLIADEKPPTVLAVANEFATLSQRRKVIRVINDLLELGKLDRVGERVTNCRAEFELANQFNSEVDRNMSNRKRAYSAWRAEWSKRRENGELTSELFNEIKGTAGEKRSTRARARGNTPETTANDAQIFTNDQQISKSAIPNAKLSNDFNGAEGHKIRQVKFIKETLPTVEQRKGDGDGDDEVDFAIPEKAKRRSRKCPVSFMPSLDELDDMTLAMTRSWEPGEFEIECAKFKDHEFATPKSDWKGTFRNWCRTHHERRATKPRNGTSWHDRPSGWDYARAGPHPKPPPVVDDYDGLFLTPHEMKNVTPPPPQLEGPSDEPDCPPKP